MLSLLVLSLAGCSSTHQANSSDPDWEGRTYTQLQEQFGEPFDEFDDGAGGKVVSYSSASIDQGMIYACCSLRNRSNSYMGINDARIFWINREGVIYKQGFK